MDDAVSLDAPVRGRLLARLRRRARSAAPARSEVALALLSAALIIFSFPDFNLWPLAWVGLVPLFLAVARRPGRGRAFLLGLMTGAVYFYGSCYWLTHSMIRYGGIPAWVAFLLLVPGALLLGVFPALCSMGLARAVARWGGRALFAAPLMWVAMEWARLGVTGQLWNAVGYSQAYATPLIQSARWGGVYLVSFLIVLVNAAAAHMLFERTARAMKLGSAAVLCAALVVAAAFWTASPDGRAGEPAANS
ncbi:MAG TPA: hypothetical protein VD861_15170, partial [Pyrinomonadaceae bacterium]|nr:hypothetical protein [Pyrinomonadaceae bacterium]